jgi:hypothetical protein
MDALSLSLVILVLFFPLLAFFATTKQNAVEAAPSVKVNESLRETLHPSISLLQRPRTRSESCAPVLRQNVAVARLMRMEAMPLI